MENRTFLTWQNLRVHLRWIYQGTPQSPQGKGEHNFFTAWYILRGHLDITANHTRLYAVPGDWLILPIGPDQRHFTPDTRILSLHFSADWVTGQHLFEFQCPLLFKPRETKGWLTTARLMLRLVKKHFPDIYTTLLRQSIDYTTYVTLQYYLQTWLQKILPKLKERSISIHLPTPKDERAVAMKTMLDVLSLHHPFRLSALSRTFHLSSSQANRIFFAEFSITPKRYFERRRLEYATASLHNTSKPVKEISYELGFKYLSEFSAWYKKHTTFSPRTHRSRLTPKISISSKSGCGA